MYSSVLDFQSFNNRYLKENKDHETEPEEKFYVYYILGEKAVELYTKEIYDGIPKKQVKKEEFNTQEEADAFEKGLKAVDGWYKVIGIRDKEYEKIINK